jgi:hypothetical protein
LTITNSSINMQPILSLLLFNSICTRKFYTVS